MDPNSTILNEMSLVPTTSVPMTSLSSSVPPTSTTKKPYRLTDVNFFFISTEYCLTKYSSSYCNYSVFIIFMGYLCSMLVFPFLLNRMRKISREFRNQYNISFPWLCSIFLVFSIDIIEFFLINDGQVYSVAICLLQIAYLTALLLTIIQYFRNYSIDGSLVRNIMMLLLTVIMFVLALVGRVLSKRTLTNFPNIDQISPISFHILNMHFFIYFFIYVFFATVQVYQNAKNKFARCLTNFAYVSWVLGSFMLSFYSEVLPKRLSYDFIHYRNYFLLTTIIVIFLQDINFIRIKLYGRAANLNINSISMRELSEKNLANQVVKEEDKERQFIEQAFSDDVQHNSTEQNPNNEDEETFFDIEEYNIKGSTIIKVNNLEKATSSNVQIRPDTKKSMQAEMQRIINNNQTRLIVLFVIILVCVWVYCTVYLFKTVTFSHFALAAPLAHPVVILFSLVFKKFSCKTV